MTAFLIADIKVSSIIFPAPASLALADLTLIVLHEGKGRNPPQSGGCHD